MKELRLDDFTQYTFLSGIKYSPSGEHACFVAHRADVDENDYKSNLWLYNVSEESYFKLTGLGSERSFTWLDNSEEILFSSLRDKKDKERQKKGESFTVFYKINISGGEATEAFRVPLRVQTIKPLADNKYLLGVGFNPNRKELDSLKDEEKAAELRKIKEEKDYEVLEEIPYWGNGRGFISRTRFRLYLYDANEHTWEPLTGETFQTQGVQLNKDKSKAVVVGNDFIGKAPLNNAIYILDFAKKAIERITPTEDFSYSNAFFLDEERIICTGNPREKFGLNENPRFYLVDIKDGSKTNLTPDHDRSIWSSVGSDCRYGGGEGIQLDRDHLYFVTTENDSSHLNRINSKGKIEKIIAGQGSIDSYSVHDGNILFVGLRGLTLQELYSFRADNEKKVTDFNDWVTETRQIIQPEPLSFEVEPGVTIEGWVLKPVNYDEEKKYPAILNIHGGPKTVFGPVFFHEMQYWANRGYFVLFCNPRGSDGKGNEFADIRGKYGTIDYEDLMSFTDLALENYPGIDSERLGVAGGSYGGFMTNWIIGQTDRFKAAASQRSISNWVSMGYTADIGYYFVDDQIGANPWTDHEKLWEHSPLKYADRVKTPTLFIHSEEDYRCWLPEGLQMFTALKYHGIESRLCMFRGENHELSRSGKPKHRIRRLEEITSWFDRFLQE